MTRPRIVALTQRADDVPGRSERRDALDQRWGALVSAAGYVPVPVPNLLTDLPRFVERVEPALLVLSGGNDLADLPGAQSAAPERDALEHALLDLAARERIPVLAVCRGLQMMVRHGGGCLRRVGGHVGAPHPIEVLDTGAWPLRSGRVVNSFHGWGAEPADLGPDLVPLALAPDGTVEAAAHRVLTQVGVMWHPERPPDDPDDVALVHALVEAV
jgi:putative glutamine amidotransferase